MSSRPSTWSACACVKRIASTRGSRTPAPAPADRATCRRAAVAPRGELDQDRRPPAAGRADRPTGTCAQRQPIIGTPCEVPVPRNVTRAWTCRSRQDDPLLGLRRPRRSACAARRGPARGTAAPPARGCRVVFSWSIPRISIIWAAPGRFGSAACRAPGGAMSPKCTAAVVTSDRTKALNVTRSRVCSDVTRMPRNGSIRAMPPHAGRRVPAPRRGRRRACARPGGCPWDREQTLETLRPFVLEETYEVLDAIETRRPRGAPGGDRRLHLRGRPAGAGVRRATATSRSPTRSPPSPTSSSAGIPTCSAAPRAQRRRARSSAAGRT